MPNENASKIPDDEIDLRSVGGKIYSVLTYPFDLFLSNKIITLCFFVAAVLFSVVLNRTATKTYTSSFIIQPLDKHEKAHLKILSDIQLLLKYKDFASAARELSLDSVVAKKIVALQTVNPVLKNNVDSVNSTEVIITTTDFNQFIPIQTALINYLENSPYFLKIRELQKKQIDIELEQVEKDLVQLDSLKVLQLRTFGKQTISGQNSVLLNELIDPTALYAAQTERINKKTNLIARSVFLDNFQLIKSCVVIRQATFPPRILIICSYLIPAFLVICFLFLAFRSRSRKTKSVTETNTSN